MANRTASPAVRPVDAPVLDRIASGVVAATTPVMLAVGMWFGWLGNLLQWQDILVLVICYAVIGTGITVGFHRLLTHGASNAAAFSEPPSRRWDRLPPRVL